LTILWLFPGLLCREGDLEGRTFSSKTEGPPCQSVSVVNFSTRCDLQKQHFSLLPVCDTVKHWRASTYFTSATKNFSYNFWTTRHQSTPNWISDKPVRRMAKWWYVNCHLNLSYVAQFCYHWRKLGRKTTNT
jgi:hypothetical protein